ncbi:MAG: YtxH domain-containing protein [Caldilineales bacterium]|nr:YtxH domain-containing protein [Caldilineales bacterium]
MKGLFGFVFGIAVGAVAALLLAPETSEELRHQILDTTTRDMTKLQDAMQRDMNELNTRVAKMQTDLQSYFQKATEIDIIVEETETPGEAEA